MQLGISRRTTKRLPEHPSRPGGEAISFTRLHVIYITQTRTNSIPERMYFELRLVRRLIQLLHYQFLGRRELLHSGARGRSFRAHVKLLPVLDTLAEEAQAFLLALLQPENGGLGMGAMSALETLSRIVWSRDPAVVMCGQSCFAMAVRSESET